MGRWAKNTEVALKLEQKQVIFCLRVQLDVEPLVVCELFVLFFDGRNIMFNDDKTFCEHGITKFLQYKDYKVSKKIWLDGTL